MEQNAQLLELKEQICPLLYTAKPNGETVSYYNGRKRVFKCYNSFYWPDEAVIKFIQKNRQNRSYNRKLTITKQNQVLVKIIDTWASKTK